MNRLTESEVQALIVLLGDEDDWTARIARERLLAGGLRVMPQLEAAANAEDFRLRSRARLLLESIRLSALTARFRRFAYQPDDKLKVLEGAFLIAQIGYPEVDRSRYERELDYIEEELRVELQGVESPLKALDRINRVFFGKHGFRGDRHQFYNPDNSFLNRVIDRRRGIPITLSVLYSVLARRVGLPMTGVGMPGHFIVRFDLLTDCFIDPFNEGQLLTRADCISFLSEAGYGYDDAYLRPVRVRSIIARMLVNLVQIYSQLEDHERASRITEFFNIVLQRDS